MNAADESSESRIWKCPECGHVEEIDQDWLADHGDQSVANATGYGIQPKDRGTTGMSTKSTSA